MNLKNVELTSCFLEKISKKIFIVLPQIQTKQYKKVKCRKNEATRYMALPKRLGAIG